MMAKVVVAGGRTYTNTGMVFICLEKIVQKGDVIISGHAKGVDMMGELYAQKNNLACEIYPAEWDKYGRSAGPRRNEQMAQVADKVVVFWDFKSRGTKNMVEMAKKYKKELFIFDYFGNLRQHFWFDD
jgi:predicted Rossmann fold nucleotide-binding protein DprA/Smf involved in DNA uptake